MSEIQEKWSNPDHIESKPIDWRADIARFLDVGDIAGMKKSSQLWAQLKMITLAHEAESETVQYNAAAFILSQEGNGPNTKIQHSVEYSKMAPMQLINIISSNLDFIQAQNPAFDIKGLLTSANQKLIDGEFEDVPRETEGSK